MRKLTIILTALFFLTSCKKEKGADALTGTWTLTEVYDKSTSTTTTAPSSGSVEITFHPGNTYSGHTRVNTFTGGTYLTTGTDKITFGTFSMTQIVEDNWGSNFLTVLMSCMLQSLAPCAPSTFSIQGNTLKIQSRMRYDVTLKRN
jgi:hypothetical protein